MDSQNFKPLGPDLSHALNHLRLNYIPSPANSRLQESINLQHNASKERAEIAKEIGMLTAELEKTRQEFSDYKAQQRKQHRADAKQSIADQKKLLRHDYLVAAFTFALTLSIEHFSDIVDLIQRMAEYIAMLIA